ncbi:iron-binding protein [Rothia sp. HMSC066H02]|uniref:HtaA domain-containing protein n=1 Tax=unclassified Rothia (in: high G+C Gram-positive bacteria) TaxID=2689056 RepID=UPI0008A5227C|nr:MULTISPECIES: HtaA domain-containing protein [unclassified Rothia (in: high G+C Gram-positive bacteria)]OFO94739.1 iron-binding protein [Rothia sp. HMSC065D09]OFP13093.1 iron-binding protein [Rothia sp. HMSC066H02]
MSTPSLTKRTWAFLASATIGLSGVAGVPAAFAAETNSHISAGEVAAASEQSLQDVTVNWGLKKSFRSYINGAFSQGSQELTGVTTNEDGSYHFTSAEGTVANGEYSVTFTGSSIHYTAHHGLLEVIISDLSVTIKDGVGTVRANVQSRPYNGNTTPNDLVETKNMTIGTFNASGLKVEGNTITLPSVDEENGTRVKLSEEATGAFAGFYKAGQELDALGFSATIVTKEAPAPSPEPSTEPSAEPTAAPTAEPSSEAPKPAEPTSAAPSAAPTSAAPSSPAATTEPKREEKVTGNVVESGTLSWDIRESFLKYLTGFAHGSVNVEGMEKTAAGGFKYTQASGVYNPETKTGQINFAGTAEFTGHNGQLKSTIKNMRLVVVNGKGTLVADVDALTRDGKSVSKTGLAIAEVDLSGASVKDSVFSAQNAAVSLTDEGSDVLFAGQYRGADNAMAPLSFSVKLSEQTAENTVEVPRISENKGSDNKGSENGSSDNSSSNTSDNSSSNSSDNSGANGSGSNGSAGTSGSVSNGGSSSNGSVSNNPAQPVCVPVTRTREVQEQGASDGTIKSANLGWGVRDSFRNYVRGGIANGSWELNGTSYSSDAFNWSNGTGTFKGGKGSISFSGSVRFTGHHGILDTTIANPRLEINGNSGTLYATMNSNDPSGKATNYGEVALLKVDLSGLQSSADAVSVNGAATTLTAEGAKAFAGFYEAGKDMAPLSFSAAINGAKTTTKTVSETVYEGEGCDPVTGKPLASTGASGVEGTLVAGFIAVAAGAGTVVYTRRRKKA